MLVVVTYDIPEDKRRTQIHKALKDFGQRVQYSVFECELTDEQYLRMRDRLERLLHPNDDSVRFYFLCEGCQPRIERIGGPPPIDGNSLIL